MLEADVWNVAVLKLYLTYMKSKKKGVTFTKKIPTRNQITLKWFVSLNIKFAYNLKQSNFQNTTNSQGKVVHPTSIQNIFRVPGCYKGMTIAKRENKPLETFFGPSNKKTL